MIGTSPFAGLHVLADDDPRWKADPVEQARAACAGGASVVQLRAKHGPDARTLAWAREIRRITADRGVRFVVNDRFDLALASEADGVHLGQDDLPPGSLPAAVRRALGVGRSTHDLDQVRRTAGEDVDYVAFGPIFGTTSKDSPHPARGVDLLAEAAATAAPRPLVAIGGITAENLPRVLAAGAAGAAVISAVAGAADPVAAVRSLARSFAAADRGASP